jgi:hypothetical protein
MLQQLLVWLSYRVHGLRELSTDKEWLQQQQRHIKGDLGSHALRLLVPVLPNMLKRTAAVLKHPANFMSH